MIQISGPLGWAGLGLLLLSVTAGALALAARPWDAPAGAALADRLRVAWAAARYDLFLDLRGVARASRRDLCAELRANLWDAAAQVGASRAIDALGSLRSLAARTAAAVHAAPTSGTRGSRLRARMGHAGGVAAAATATAVFVEFLMLLAWADGAQASGADRVAGSVTLLPGSSAVYQSASSGFSVELSLGWIAPLIGALAFLIALRPWSVAAGATARR